MTAFLNRNAPTVLNGSDYAGATLLNSEVLAQTAPELARPRWLLWQLPKNKWVARMFITGLLTCVVVYEIRTSAFQSRLLSFFAQQMTYTLGSGPSSTVAFPKVGPFNLRHGYAHIPDFQRRLESGGFSVTEQAHFSRWLARIVRWGIAVK
jgi:hypothetical protein